MDWQDELRTLLSETKELKTPFFSINDVDVSLVDWSNNPYHAMFEMATQTWGFPGKWQKATPRLRFEVVKMILEKKALPLALEAPSFTFQINNTTRAAFDQIARARVGVVIAARGFKDNDLSDEGFVIPPYSDKTDIDNIITLVKFNKIEYNRLRRKYPGWMARCVMQMGTRYNFIWSSTYMALQNLCSNRMNCLEEPSTVAVSWLMKKALASKFPLLADYLRPLEAWKNKCIVKEFNGFSGIVGIPHAECSLGGHQSVESGKPNLHDRGSGQTGSSQYVECETVCTDVKKLLQDLNVNGDFKNYTWETLEPHDKELFERNRG